MVNKRAQHPHPTLRGSASSLVVALAKHLSSSCQAILHLFFHFARLISPKIDPSRLFSATPLLVHVEGGIVSLQRDTNRKKCRWRSIYSTYIPGPYKLSFRFKLAPLPWFLLDHARLFQGRDKPTAKQLKQNTRKIKFGVSSQKRKAFGVLCRLF
jgi:hypothetical protein